MVLSLSPSAALGLKEGVDDPALALDFRVTSRSEDGATRAQNRGAHFLWHSTRRGGIGRRYQVGGDRTRQASRKATSSGATHSRIEASERQSRETREASAGDGTRRADRSEIQSHAADIVGEESI